MTNLPAQIPTGVLTQRNPAYMEKEWRELSDLYCGGYALRHKKEYLPQLPNEHPNLYAKRLGSAGYINFLGETVSHYGARLFQNECSVIAAPDADDPTTPGDYPSDWWVSFGKDCDHQGTSFSTLLQNLFTTASLKRKAIVAIDLPSLEEAPRNRAEEISGGALDAWCYEVPVEQLVDWKMDCKGDFEFAVIESVINERRSIAETRGMGRVEWKCWSIDGGKARWDIYATDELPMEKLLQVKTVPWRSGGVTDFDKIPLLCLDFPDKLWLGNKIGTLCLEHYQRRSALVSAGNKSLVAIPAAFLGPELPTAQHMVSASQEKEERGEHPRERFERDGFMVFGADDKFEFVSPSPAAYEFTSKELSNLRDDIYRTVAHMGAAVDNSAAVARQSAHAKKMDNKPETKLLYAFADAVAKFGCKIYGFIAKARGEDVVWTMHGLSDYEEVDRPVLIDEAQGIQNIRIPSPTFKKRYMLETAKKLLGPVDAQTTDTIRKEIDEGVSNEADDSEKLSAVPGPLSGPASETVTATDDSQGEMTNE